MDFGLRKTLENTKQMRNTVGYSNIRYRPSNLGPRQLIKLVACPLGRGGELVEQVKSSPPTSGTREKKVRTALSIDPSRCHPNDPQLAPPRKVLNQFGIADTVAIPTDADQIRSEPREAPTAMYQLAANKHSSYFIEKRTECLGRKKKLSSIPLYKLYCKSARTSG